MWAGPSPLCKTCGCRARRRPGTCRLGAHVEAGERGALRSSARDNVCARSYRRRSVGAIPRHPGWPRGDTALEVDVDLLEYLRSRTEPGYAVRAVSCLRLARGRWCRNDREDPHAGGQSKPEHQRPPSGGASSAWNASITTQIARWMTARPVGSTIGAVHGRRTTGEAASQRTHAARLQRAAEWGSRCMHGERSGRTIQASGLVRETCLRVAHARTRWRDERHFVGIAARRCARLVERASRRCAYKQRAGLDRVSLVGSRIGRREAGDSCDVPAPGRRRRASDPEVGRAYRQLRWSHNGAPHAATMLALQRCTKLLVHSTSSLERDLSSTETRL